MLPASIQIFGFLLLLVATMSAQPSLQQSIDALASRDEATWSQALHEIGLRPIDAARPAVPAIIRLLDREGSDETALYCDDLARFGAAAVPGLPVLVRHFEQIEGQSVPLQECIEDIAAAGGPSVIPIVLRIVADRVRLGSKEFPNDVNMRLEVGTWTRMGFDRPIDGFKEAADGPLRRALASRDPFIRAEAAYFFGGDVARGRDRLPVLRRAIARERDQWARHQMQHAIGRLQGKSP